MTNAPSPTAAATFATTIDYPDRPDWAARAGVITPLPGAAPATAYKLLEVALGR